MQIVVDSTLARRAYRIAGLAKSGQRRDNQEHLCRHGRLLVASFRAVFWGIGIPLREPPSCVFLQLRWGTWAMAG